MKPTADQVIKEFDALPSEQKRQVYYNISIKNGDANIFSLSIKPGEAKTLNTVLKAIYERGSSTSRRKSKPIRSQKVLWKNILVSFVPNIYVQDYEEIWRLESVLGSDVVRNSLRKHRILDASFIERLFGQSPYSFYTNQKETYLFSEHGDLSESDGGPLNQLTALDALQRYGLKLIEESKEKQYTRL